MCINTRGKHAPMCEHRMLYFRICVHVPCRIHCHLTSVHLIIMLYAQARLALLTLPTIQQTTTTTTPARHRIVDVGMDPRVYGHNFTKFHTHTHTQTHARTRADTNTTHIMAYSRACLRIYFVLHATRCARRRAVVPPYRARAPPSRSQVLTLNKARSQCTLVDKHKTFGNVLHASNTHKPTHCVHCSLHRQGTARYSDGTQARRATL